MTITIRSAQHSDLASLAVLFDGYRVYYKQAHNLDVAQKFLAERLENGDSTIFVAESSEGGLLGFVQLYPIFSSVSARRSLLLNDLFVAESARRLGIARKLMDHASAYAKAQGVCWLMLQTEQTNSKAQSLYESLGYKRDEECFYYYLSMND